MAPIEFKLDGLDEILKTFEGLEHFTDNNTTLLSEVGALMQDQVGRTFASQSDPLTGQPWKPTGDTTNSTRPGGEGGKALYDTGGLLQSLTGSTPRLGVDSVSVFTNLPYARIHQEGGTITPKRAKMLTIPLTREARRAASARDLGRRKSSKLFVRESKSGFLFLSEDTGRRIVNHYLLVKSVTIPQRRFMGFGDTYADEIIGLVDTRLGELLEG